MANTYAIVEKGTVTNIVLWDGETDTWQPPEGSQAVLIPDDVFVSIGCTYDGKKFSPSAQP
ncbi:MAG: hypothetical protein VYB88_17945 [Pseudomonadota bacterium]|uniref:hypothetical protein n=1 Tax=Ralstonia pickettii TaxID=329 RepID=UPI002714F892|nr:hypothetical protein [Ralstonia pickettii]MEE2979349.1 hypothetical protein [Pseudomonadota bacterium]WKZ84155.1 hypothetical protein N5B55_10195 [Ralstonia pickettii]